MSAYQEHSDTELILLVSKDDREAFAEIYQRYKAPLFLHAFRILGNDDETKDVLQELFTTLWVRRSSIDLKGSLSSYLYTSVRNRIFDLIAHKKVEDRYIHSLATFIDEGECVTDHQVREKELGELIEKEVSLLPPKMREIFQLSRNEQLSYKEIAEELNISDKTVKKQVSNALSILRERLDVAFVLTLFLLEFKIF